MNIKREILIILILVATLGVILFLTQGSGFENPPTDGPNNTPTTNETGGTTSSPNNEKSEIIITGKVGTIVQGVGASIEILEITEDSRCPIDVVCIQAGTVKARVKITNADGERALVMELNKPLISAREKIELILVQPDARSEIPIRVNEYRLTFNIKKT